MKFILSGLVNTYNTIVSENYVKTYPATSWVIRIDEYWVFVNGEEVFVNAKPVVAYTYFDIEGKLDIEIKQV